MLRLLSIARLERVAVLTDGVFERLLGPGSHLVWTLGRELVTYTVSAAVETIDFGDPIPAETQGQRQLIVKTGERVLVTIDGAQHRILEPGKYRIWDGLGEVELRTFDLLQRPAALPADDRVAVMARMVEAAATADQAVVLMRDGRPVERLERGRYRAWSQSPWALTTVNLQLQGLEVAAQDLVTADQIPVRIKPSVAFRVSDPVQFILERTQAAGQVYTAVQLALRELVSAKVLEQLLSDRSALGDAVLNRARELLPNVGLVIEQAAVKDVILPGEVKDLLAKVTLARKEAEALSIRRREEVAATRQLANTAKLLEKNPVLTRLKELEALGELVGRIDRITLVGGPADLVPRLLTDAARER